MNIAVPNCTSQNARMKRSRPNNLGSVIPHLRCSGQKQNAAQVNALAIVAHDLRGPLASISALLELIDTHGQRRNTERVSTCTRRASDIIASLDDMLNAILERVKKTGDPLGYRPSVVEVGDLLKKAVSLNRPNADSQAVALKCDVPGPVLLWGDYQLLLQAIENLIGNAVKHTKTGGAVRCESRGDDQQVLIRIIDQGEGFSALDLRRGFRPFTKLSAKSSADAQSWGLGLWMVRLIVERHGGHIDVDTGTAGVGTEITVCLPVSSERGPAKMAVIARTSK